MNMKRKVFPLVVIFVALFLLGGHLLGGHLLEVPLRLPFIQPATLRAEPFDPSTLRPFRAPQAQGAASSGHRLRKQSVTKAPSLQGVDPSELLIRRLREVTNNEVRISYHAHDQKLEGASMPVRFIGTTLDDAIPQPAPLSPDATSEEAARAFLGVYGVLFGLAEPSEELVVMTARTLADGRSFVRFRQVAEGLPVIGGELIVQVDANQEIISASGEILPNLRLDTEAVVDAQTARQIAVEKVAKDFGVPVEQLLASEAQLSIYNPILLGGPGPRLNALVWRVDVTPRELAPINSFVLVDAYLGVIALHFNLSFDVKNRIVYDNNNNSTLGLPGIDLLRREGEAATGITDIDLAYDYTGDTYDFFMDQHGRDSLDDAGMDLVSTVRYCPNDAHCPYENAFWDGTQLVFGEGHAAADDVVGHELTHGLTQFSSSLFYYYQSGAINESFSDLWGEFVDLTNQAGTDTPAVRWQIGEDIPVLGAVRDMQDPTVFLHPDRIGSEYYSCGETDNGGVHINSGVNNKAVALMTDGGTFNGVTVTALGISKVADLYYEAQNNLLTSAADYADLYDALLQASHNLGYSASDRENIQKALLAVEMNQAPRVALGMAGTCGVREAPVCAAGQPTDLFFDDFEAGEQKWTPSSSEGEIGWFVPQESSTFLTEPYATSGEGYLWGYNQFRTSDTAMAIKQDISLPKVAFMHFQHAFGFEFDARHPSTSGHGSTYYDGGVLEYSTDGGQRWKDAGHLFTHNGYNSKLSGAHPLRNRAAFGADSPGYTSSRLDLSPLAGQSVRFRFRMATDSVGEDYGWFIDDVRIYTCSQAEADLALEISAPESVAIGKPFTYTLNVSNKGPYPATNIVLSDTLPANAAVTFREASGGVCEEAEGVVTCLIDALSSDESKAISLVVNAPSLGGEISNHATVSATEPDLYPTNNQATVKTLINPSDLALTRMAKPSVVIGQSLIYTLTVTNNGPFAAPNVVLTDTLPSQVTFQSVKSTQGSCQEAAGVISCALGTIQNKSSEHITIVLTPPFDKLRAAPSIGGGGESQVLYHKASVAGDELDPDPSNNLNVASQTFVTNPPAPRYVSPNGRDESDCSEQANPCRTIAHAVTQAAFGDTIDLAAGTYRENVTIDRELTLQGRGINETIIDGKQADSVFLIENNATVTINDLTISNGSGSVCTADEQTCGGAIHNLGILTLNNSRLSDNQADWGGGAIYNEYLLTVNGSEFSDNNASWGGAIYNLGTLSVNESHFSHNDATRGGAIYNWVATVVVNGSTFSDNHGTYGGGIHNLGALTVNQSSLRNNESTWGGGLYNSEGNATLTDSTISGNRAIGSSVSFGGGLYNWGGTVKVSHSSIISNSTTNSGGGINSFFGQLTVEQSTISHNRVTELDGGAINGSGIIEISNSTLSGNQVANQGAAIWYYDGTLTLNHVTISDNHAQNGAHALFITDTVAVNLKNTLIANHFDGPNCIAQPDTPISSLGHNLSHDDTCHLNQPTDLPNTNPHLAPLTDNGGPTHTHALLPTSPAISAGDCPPTNTTDQRGITRKETCDIGAYEYENKNKNESENEPEPENEPENPTPTPTPTQHDTNKNSPLINILHKIAPCLGVEPKTGRWDGLTRLTLPNALCLLANLP